MKARKASPMFGILFAFLITPPVIRAGEFGQATKFTPLTNQLRLRDKSWLQVATGGNTAGLRIPALANCLSDQFREGDV